MTWKSRVRFSLAWKGAPSLEDVEGALPLVISSKWREGSVPKHGAPRKWSMLTVDSEVPEEAPLEEHIEAMISKLRLFEGELKAAIREFGLEPELALVLFYDPEVDSIPGVHLASSALSLLATLGAELDVDLIEMKDE